jgi:hypothetical protein
MQVKRARSLVGRSVRLTGLLPHRSLQMLGAIVGEENVANDFDQSLIVVAIECVGRKCVRMGAPAFASEAEDHVIITT